MALIRGIEKGDKDLRHFTFDDEDYVVRAEVAKQGYGLDKLIKDKDYRVRNRVAMQGYGLDKLANDKDYRVRETVKFMLNNNINKLA